MLVTLKEILADARDRHYAVAAFDCVEDVMVRTILDTCERLRSPVILAALTGADLDGRGWDYISGLIRSVAGGYDIPIALHLDHATELDSIAKAVDMGFSSVMIDGSALAFEDNVAITQQTVAIARPKGVSVEAELGFVGGADLAETVQAESVLTNADEVAQFVEQTSVDALAVSVGTAHGVYKSLPNLNIERLKELNAASAVPLVLHGGSGTPNDQIQEAVRNGICKLNVYADCRIAMTTGLKASAASLNRPDTPLRDLFGPISDQLASVIEDKVRLLMSDGKA